MELTRLIRIIRGRWIGVAVVAVLGLIVAVVVTSRRNEQRTPEFYATAALIFNQDSFDRTGEELALRLQDAQVDAIDVNRETMIEFPDAAVTFDAELSELYFSAPGSSDESAAALARQMRDAFLAVESAVNSDVITEELEALAEEIGPLQVELAQLQEVPVDVQLNNARYDYLAGQIAAFEQRATNLRLELVPGLSDRDPIQVQSELTAVEREIEQLNRQLLAIPEEDPLEVANRDLQIKAVSRRIQLLELQYQELYLEQGSLEDRIRLGRVTVADETPEEASVGVNGVLGIVAGIFVSIGGLVLSERTRPLVWMQGDLRALPLLAQVPRRRQGEGAFIWYETAPTQGRKSALQTLRGAIEGRLGGEVTSIGITGLSSADATVQPLAADLAVAMAVSGRSVLLIDAGFTQPSGLFEYSSTGPTLSDILSASADDAEGFASLIKQVLEDTPAVRPGLVALRPGEGLDDPADALAGGHMRRLLGEAEDVFDLIIVAIPEARTPSGQTLLQRVDFAVLAVTPGGSTVAMSEGVVADLMSRNVAFLGMVFLPKRSSEAIGAGSIGLRHDPQRGGRAQPIPLGRLEPSPVDPPRRRTTSLAGERTDDWRDGERVGHTRVGDPWRDDAAQSGRVNIEFIEDQESDALAGDEALRETADLEAEVRIRRDGSEIEEDEEGEEDEEEGDEDGDEDEDEDQTSLVVPSSDEVDSNGADDVEESASAPTQAEVDRVDEVLRGMRSVSLPTEALEAGFGAIPDRNTFREFLTALEKVEPRDILEDIETILTSWVTALVATPLRTHHANRNSVVRYAFIPLFDIKGFSPIRARIRKEFDGPLGARNARRFLVGLERIIRTVAGDGLPDRYSINEWVVDRYWARYVEDTDRAPTVWHLSSRNGAIQALVDWTRMDREHIDVLRTEMVRQRIETLRRKTKAAARAGHAAEAAAFDDQVKDARSFDLALGWLYDGTTPRARIWYPWRTSESPIGWRPNPRQGVKPHLAPLQRLDLLAFAVLTDEEMMRLKPPG